MTKVIADLKSQKGKDIIIYGGASFVSSLIKLDIIDQYHFVFNASILGSGMPIFQYVEVRLKLNLIKATAGESGMLFYTMSLLESEAWCSGHRDGLQHK